MHKRSFHHLTLVPRSRLIYLESTIEDIDGYKIEILLVRIDLRVWFNVNDDLGSRSVLKCPWLE